MHTLYLVRHGEAAADWQSASDPGLSDRGRAQAQAVAGFFQAQASMPLISSPLARTRETAEPLAQRWRVTVSSDSRFAEIPSAGIALPDRSRWLRQLLQQRWDEQPASLRQWRQAAADALRQLTQSSVIFTHFVLINAVVSAIRKQEQVLQFLPDNGSITRLQLHKGELTVIALGKQNKSLVN